MAATPTFITQLSQIVTFPFQQLYIRLAGRGAGDDLEIPGAPFIHPFPESIWREIATRIGRGNYTFPVHVHGTPSTNLPSLDQEVFVRLNTLASEGLRLDFMTALRERTLSPEVFRTLLLNVDETTRVSVMEATNIIVGPYVSSESVIHVSQVAMLLALPNLTAFFHIMGVFDTGTIVIQIRELFSGRRFSDLSQQDLLELYQSFSQNITRVNDVAHVAADADTEVFRAPENEARLNNHNHVANRRFIVYNLALVGVFGVTYWFDPATATMLFKNMLGIPTIERLFRLFFA